MSQHPTGRFTATVQSITVGESSKAKTPGVFFVFDTDHGTIDGALWLTEKAYERTLKTLRECFGFNDNFNEIEWQVKGCKCSITIEDEPDQKDATKSWPRVKWINPVGAEAAPVASSLLSDLSKRAKLFARPADAPKPKQKPAQTAPANNEDAPF